MSRRLSLGSLHLIKKWSVLFLNPLVFARLLGFSPNQQTGYFWNHTFTGTNPLRWSFSLRLYLSKRRLRSDIPASVWYLFRSSKRPRSAWDLEVTLNPNDLDLLLMIWIVASDGLGWEHHGASTEKCNNPGGDSYCVGGGGRSYNKQTKQEKTCDSDTLFSTFHQWN